MRKGPDGVKSLMHLWEEGRGQRDVGKKGQRSPGGRPHNSWEDALRNLGFIIKAMGNHRQV